MFLAERNLLRFHYTYWAPSILLRSTHYGYYKLRKCTKWSKLSFWVKMIAMLSVAQLVTTVIFFSASDKSRAKWDNSQKSAQKMRTPDPWWYDFDNMGLCCIIWHHSIWIYVFSIHTYDWILLHNLQQTFLQNKKEGKIFEAFL